MELHDIHSVRLASENRRESLRRSMDPARQPRARRRIGRALVSLGARIAGEQLPEPARRYA